MKVLITGGAGCIGSHVADALVGRGDEVYIIDNFSTGRRDNIPRSSLVTFKEGSIATYLLMRDVITDFKPDAVVHAAASYADPNEWLRDLLVNTQGTTIVARECREAGVRKLIYYQTALCYGLRPKSPVPIGAPFAPEGSSYALSKTAGEQYIKLSGVPYVSLRLANVFGPRNLSGPVPSFYKRITGDLKSTVVRTRRDMIYVDCVADLTLRALDSDVTGPFNVASGSDMTIPQVFAAVRKAIGSDAAVEYVDPKPDDAPTILLDHSKTLEAFEGWRAQRMTDERIAATVEWYDSHEIGETYTHLKMETK